jgi:hypothetical protein
MSLQRAVSDEAISVFGQRLLRSARNDALTLCPAMGFCPIVLSKIPPRFPPFAKQGIRAQATSQKAFYAASSPTTEFRFPEAGNGREPGFTS